MIRMLGTWNFKQKPTGLFKWVLRVPSALYRLHLGFVFGQRFMLITHRGSRSGRLHQTPVEVLEHDTKTREYIVCSGLGRKSDWYQNLVALGPVAVQVRGKRWIPAMRMLDADEAAARLLNYERRHPALAKRLLASMGRSYNGTNTDRHRMVQEMPMIAFSDTARTKNAWAARS